MVQDTEQSDVDAEVPTRTNKLCVGQNHTWEGHDLLFSFIVLWVSYAYLEKDISQEKAFFTWNICISLLLFFFFFHSIILSIYTKFLKFLFLSEIS